MVLRRQASREWRVTLSAPGQEHPTQEWIGDLAQDAPGAYRSARERFAGTNVKVRLEWRAVGAWETAGEEPR